MGFAFMSVHKDIHHGFNHSEVNSSYSALLTQLHETRLFLDTKKQTLVLSSTAARFATWWD
jgi:hypothetical protein